MGRTTAIFWKKPMNRRHARKRKLEVRLLVALSVISREKKYVKSIKRTKKYVYHILA
jgi:hypothetical protein